ncbi:uncharacterized protein BDZ99DRAFT_514514 [Mytilinidion resinicola]|uniref:Uncharacterized protein n=1 Tax=Mytilinidion resinicola TaxID=574789 RepID=A0A6A6Z6L1_9PEZI|nr:uncharacterized protein BDZ99DRAFT_514514 [Mytilinidion resinicola]KAF2815875.1 hypothetical protein BDZ99DRAFT_514514 [Mytilinidion resinicola]
MDSGPPRKRPWEDNSSAIQDFSRRASAANDGSEHPMPHLSGWQARDSWDQDNRRLPPIYPPPSGVSAEHVPSQLLHSASPRFGSDTRDFTDSSERPKLRTQSLFDVSQPKRPRTGYAGESLTGPNLIEDSQPLALNLSGLLDASRPDRHQQGSCCSPNCQGQACANVRSVVQKLASELVDLDLKVRYILRSHSRAPREPPESEIIGTERSLYWALGLVQWNSLQLRKYAERLVNPNLDQETLQRDSTSNQGPHDVMKRTIHYPDVEDQSTASRLLPTTTSDYPRLPPPTNMSEDSRRSLYGSEYSTSAHSPHAAATSYSRTNFAPPQSPLQLSQTIQTGMLPSPSSMNFPTSSIPPPISPPHSHAQNAAQASHLQDLQHQVSIKTLAFQTLQREYDSLLQKLERQRTKCATLEKKFEVSDVEINSLTDEKEKMQSQIAGFEAQVEELQHSRDEARRQLVANGTQYMRIMEMASRLQAQGAEDRKKWEAEKAELEGRIKMLEEAMVVGTERTDPGEAVQSQLSSSDVLMGSSGNMPPSVSSAETVAVLRAEIGRLRARTQSLENALQAMRDESVSIQAAAQTIVAAGGKMKEAIDAGLGG